MRGLKTAITVAIFFTSLTSRAQSACHALFDSANQVIIAESIESSIFDLAKLRLRLDLAKAQGSAAPQITALRSDYKNKEERLILYFESHSLMSRQELMSRLRNEIARAQGSKLAPENNLEKEREKEVLEKTKIDGHRIVFHPVPPGRFEVEYKNNKIVIEVERSFEMAATQTTQTVWKQIAILAKNLDPEKYATLNPDPSKFKGEQNPVETVSFNDIELWLGAVNFLARNQDPIIEKLFPYHKPGDIYRLPTENEWEFVARAGGEIKSDSYFGNSPQDIDRVAWYLDNSQKATQPVGLKEPVVLNGKAFYDMLGNVYEWTSNKYQVDYSVPTRVPKGERHVHMLRGGGLFTQLHNVTISERIDAEPYYQLFIAGFRIVRATQ
jgi:formylglycine-generating enzyme required for sulfatase activity